MTSLRARITRLVLASLALIMLPLAAIGYFLTMEEMDELFEARLAQNARTISALMAEERMAAPEKLVEIASWQQDYGSPPAVRGHRYETQVGFQYWTAANTLAFATTNLREVPLDAAPAGYADIKVGKRHWRVFTLLDDKGHWVRVGERYDSRREIGRAMAIEAIAPFLFGLPVLVLVTGWAVRRGLEPMGELADRLAGRKADSIEPIGVRDLPAEMVPVVASLNDLLKRLGSAMEQERRFTAHAAHELRTPLAGALVHVENARAASPPGDTRASLDEARRGLVRLARIVNQMLELARWDAERPGQLGEVDLDHCVDEELQAFGLPASERDVAIAVRRDAAPHVVHGWEPGIRTLLRNLLDNAIRYNVHGGRVELELRHAPQGIVLAVEDGGPGIAPELRDSMFERFRRGTATSAEGSGLGLPLVARVAQLHRARVTLSTATGGRGLRVEVAFPASPAPVIGA
ncbi:MAG TPA: ATP-binding protein [Dokdonella sp.]